MLRSRDADGERDRHKAIFLDRDGVINEAVPDAETGLPESPLSVEGVRLIAGAASAVKRLADAGYLLVCTSNQPAAAKGKISLDALLSVHRRVLDLLAAEGAQIDCSCLCPHHPKGLVPELTEACGCRKPRPGLLLESAAMLSIDRSASWMVGDTDADVKAGCAAGCSTVLLEYPGSGHKRSAHTRSDLRALDLDAGMTQLLSRSLR